MKSLLAVICLLTGATVLCAETKPVVTPAKPAAAVTPGKPTTVTTPAKPGSKAKVVVKKEEEPKILGITLNRANGTFLGLEVVGGNFKLTFYDEKKKPMAIDVDRATARWPNTRDVGDYRSVLNPVGTDALVGNRFVYPPYVFTVFLSLVKGDGDETKAVESFAVQMKEY